MEMKEMSDSPIHDLKNQNWLIFTHKMTQNMSQIFSFYVSVFRSVWLIGVIKNFIFCQHTSAVHQQKRNSWKMKLWRKGSKDSLKLVWVPYYMTSRMRKKTKVFHILMTWFIHLHCPMPTGVPTSVNTCILNLGLGNMLIEIYTLLSQE